MDRIYLETNAIRKLVDYKYEGEVFTSVFSLFELISGISEDDFYVRKASVKRLIESKIPIKEQMVDQIICDFVDLKKYNSDFHKILFDTAKQLINARNYKVFSRYEIREYFEEPFFHVRKINVLSWLSQWDQRISDMRNKCNEIFDEDKEYMKKLYKDRGMKGLAQHFWGKYEDNKINEALLSHASAFCSSAEIDMLRKRADKLFTQYNFKLFMTAQAIIFAKALYIDGGTQDKNNACDLLHLLYLEKDDKLVSNDKIYSTISEGIEDFSYIHIDKEKSLLELKS